MKKDKDRISLARNEADEIRELLETLYAMEGTFDDDFNSRNTLTGILMSFQAGSAREWELRELLQ